jgi:hypothetical protein
MKTMSPQQGLSRGQIEMLGHGLNKLTVFKDTSTAEVDRFIKEVGPGWRDASAKLLEDLFQDFIGVFRVPVNCNEPNAIASAIEAGKFDGKYLGISVDEISLVGTGQIVHEVREVHFGRVVYNRDLPQALKERGKELGLDSLKFADPLTVLRFACANPNRQRKYPLTILFIDKQGQLCYLCLGGSGGERDLFVGQDDPGDCWCASVRFLAVRELPSGA